MLGELTRSHRRRLGITQEELAERTGLSARAIRAIETGRSDTPRMVTVRLLADAFGLTDADRERYFATALARPATADPALTGAAAPAPDPGTAADPAPGGGPAPQADAAAGPGRPPPAGAAAPAASTVVPVAVPQQLPVAVAGFAGRDGALERMHELLCDGMLGSVVISGTAGIGKSTLAVRWAHQVADRFPDGQLFVNLHGFGPGSTVTSAGEAVRGFLHALGVPAQRIPADLPGQSALYRSLLARRRVLVVIDNARDAAQVRPLLPGSAGCLAVITSRSQLTSLVAAEGAYPLPLNLLTAAEAGRMLASRLGRQRVAAEPAAVGDLVQRCSGLPLALAVVAARAAVHPGFPLGGLAEQLRRTGNHLDRLHGGDEVSDVRTVFSWSYRQLGGPAARLFRLLGTDPAPDTGVPAAASLAGTDPATAGALLAELADAGLVTEVQPGRYAMHDLMRGYARELAEQTDGAADRLAALRRLLDHQLHTTAAADLLLTPYREPLPLTDPAKGVHQTPIADLPEALAWFAAEVDGLLPTVTHAAATGFDDHAWQLASAMHTFLYRQGRWHEAVDVHQAGLAAAQRLGDRAAVAHCHHCSSRANLHLARYVEAQRHLHLADTAYAELGDQVGRARVQQAMGVIAERQGDVRRARRHATTLLDLARAAGNTYLQARALNAIGWHHAILGDHDQARTFCEQALILHEEIGDRDGAADAWDSLGFALYHLGQHTEAVACYQRAIDLYRDLGHRYFLAATLTHLGQTHRASGCPAQARSSWQEAEQILSSMDHPEAAGVRDLLADLDRPATVGGYAPRETGHTPRS